MLSCMAPSSPPVMRTFHLLKIPDILCANDSRWEGVYFLDIPPGPPHPFLGLRGLFSVTCTLDHSRQPIDSKGVDSLKSSF
jgi:hypothetical protein